jgi:type III secretion system YscQ/HrcQ family protein
VVRVRPAGLAFEARPEGSGETFALEVRGARGRLIIDGALALRLVAALLGAPPATALRPLGPGERGVVAGVAAALLHGAGLAAGARVGLAPPPPLPDQDVLTIELQVRAGPVEGLAWIELPPAALPAIPGAARVDPALLAPLVRVELGCTSLARGALAAAGAGDAVVFDGVEAARAGEPWPIELRFGACVLPALAHPDGTVSRRAPLFTISHESEVPMGSEIDTQPNTLPALSDEAAQALAAAPVEVVAELGRLTLRGDELVGLIEGGVLSLGARRPAQVQLRVGTRLWAMGELVAIDDELAVRIVEIVR